METLRECNVTRIIVYSCEQFTATIDLIIDVNLGINPQLYINLMHSINNKYNNNNSNKIFRCLINFRVQKHSTHSVKFTIIVVMIKRE